jgi:RNA polymerase sigma-70 factor (ECF subfamily)
MPETSLTFLDRLRSRGDEEAWRRLVELYTPLLRGWLRRYEVCTAADVDDLVQDVLAAVVKEMPHFEQQRPGAFRGWLRAILVNRLRHFWRSRDHRPVAIGGSDFLEQIEQLNDDASGASQLWDREHDRHVLARLLETLEPQLAPATWQAFRRQVLDGVSAEQTAAELGMPMHSVYAAKSRGLRALRELAAGLIS